MDPLVLESWREAEAIHGVSPARLGPSTADEAANAETVADLVKPNRGGAGTHMSIAERREVAVAFLTDRQLGTITALARKFGRTREAIAACLKGEAFDRIRDEVNASAVQVARACLSGSVVEAAEAWRDAMPVASRKGDHRPAKDLLLHMRAIESIGDESGPRVIVQIGLSESDMAVMQIQIGRDSPSSNKHSDCGAPAHRDEPPQAM